MGAFRRIGDSQHSWLKDVETNDSKRLPCDRLLGRSLEGKSMETSGFTKILYFYDPIFCFLR